MTPLGRSCPWCEASVGERCHDRDGRPVEWFHRGRGSHLLMRLAYDDRYYRCASIATQSSTMSSGAPRVQPQDRSVMLSDRELAALADCLEDCVERRDSYEQDHSLSEEEIIFVQTLLHKLRLGIGCA